MVTSKMLRLVMSRPNGNGSSALKQKTPIQAESSDGEPPPACGRELKKLKGCDLGFNPSFYF